MKTKKSIIILLFIFLFGCSSQDSGSHTDSSQVKEPGIFTGGKTKSTAIATTPEEARQEKAVNEKEIAIEKKVIKTGTIQMEVNNYEQTRKKMLQIIKNQDAYISNENETKNAYRLSNQLTLRVPKENFDTLVVQITALADKLDSKRINLKDVTEEYIDITTRLKNKREVEKRYREILRDAKTITDILKVEEHLRVVREEIEAKEGRLKFLNNQVSLSTIHLTMYQEFENRSSRSFGYEISDAFRSGWHGLVSVFLGLIHIWPLLFIWIAVIIMFLIRHNKKSRKKE